MPLVIAMWLLTAGAWVAALGFRFLMIGSMLDLTATTVGVVLLCLPAPRGKIHGCLKLTLQFAVTLLVVVLLCRQGILTTSLTSFVSRMNGP